MVIWRSAVVCCGRGVEDWELPFHVTKMGRINSLQKNQWTREDKLAPTQGPVGLWPAGSRSHWNTGREGSSTAPEDPGL
jgi:hypothetical protein